MSIKTDAVVIRDEVITGANTAVRVGTNLADIADDLVAKQAAIDLNTAKVSYTDAAAVALNTAKVGITPTQASDIVTNNAKVGVTTEEANPDVVSQVEAEAGVAITERIWTAERVKQAIVALGGSGSVDDTAYGISWDGVTGIAPSKNALYDFIESQVFKVDASSNIIPIFWGGTQAEYDIDFPTGHDPEYFIVITDGALTPTTASDIVNVPSGNLVATDVQGALDELQTEVDGLSGGLVVGDIDTIAELNAIVTDATLIDTADARLSDARTPTAHTHVEADITDLGTYSTDIHANIIALNAVTGTNTGDQVLTGLDYEPTKGVDDNYVTDAEKVVIGNTSGTNTGDNAVNTLYSGLVSYVDTLKEDLAVSSASFDIDWSKNTHYYELTGITTFLTQSNLPPAGQSKTITIHITGDFALTLPTAWNNINGAYAGATLNTIVVEYVAISTTPFYRVEIITTPV